MWGAKTGAAGLIGVRDSGKSPGENTNVNNGARVEARTRKLRADAGTFKVSPRDFELLRFVGEQYAVTLPQLAHLMGRSHHAARWLRSRWQAASWVEGRALLVGEPVFVWLTRRGQHVVGVDYKLWRPKPGRLAHVAAVTDVRLYVERRRPEAEWICERELARQDRLEERGRGLHRPDAVVLVQDREVAVEVELTQKQHLRSERIMRELAARYEGVWYFAADGARQAVETVAKRIGSERVQVLPLPKPERR